MRLTKIETVLMEKISQMPVSVKPLQREQPADPIGQPATLYPVRRGRTGTGAIAAAATVVVVAAAALAVWKLPDVLPALWDGGTGETTTAETTAAVGTQTTEKKDMEWWKSEYFEHLSEVEGYDEYKIDIVDKSKIAERVERFNDFETYGAFTLAALRGNFSGRDDETMIVYFVVQEVRIYRPVFVLVSGDNVQYHALPNQGQGNFSCSFELADFDGDGSSEIVMIIHTTGSGGCLYINIIKCDEDGLRDYAFEPASGPLTKFSATMGDHGQYTVINPAAGYEKIFTHEKAVEFFPEHYDENGRFIGDELIREVGIDSFTGYKLQDIDGDGIVELLVRHTFWNFVHVETFGNGFEAYKYDKETDDFQVIQAEFIQSDNGYVDFTEIWPE